MQNMGLLMEYEDILLKKRKDFSARALSCLWSCWKMTPLMTTSFWGQ